MGKLHTVGALLGRLGNRNRSRRRAKPRQCGIILLEVWPFDVINSIAPGSLLGLFPILMFSLKEAA